MPQYTVGERIEVLCNAPMVTAPSSTAVRHRDTTVFSPSGVLTAMVGGLEPIALEAALLALG